MAGGQAGTDEEATIRLMVFLCEDDRLGRRSAADVLIERARSNGSAVTLWQGVEGFGPTGRLRARRLPDLARGLPLVLEVVDTAAVVARFLRDVREVAAGSLVTTEPITSVVAGPISPGPSSRRKMTDGVGAAGGGTR